MSENHDLISRQAALKAVSWDTEAYTAINMLPSVKPEQKKGHWIVYYHGGSRFSYSCSQCGFSALYEEHNGEYSQKESNFCPNCGLELTERTDE